MRQVANAEGWMLVACRAVAWMQAMAERLMISVWLDVGHRPIAISTDVVREWEVA